MSAAERPSEDALTEAHEDAQKSYVTILAQEIEEGLEELERPARGLFLSGISAGLDIGFSVLAIAVLGGLARDASPLVAALLRANGYALGFVLVIFGRSELFTEHTTLAALPVLDRRASPTQLMRLWGLVFLGNLLGALLFSLVLAAVGPELRDFDAAVVTEGARHLLEGRWWALLCSALLAGWLMGLLSWLVTAGRDTTSQILFVWLVTGTIGLAGLRHCVLGSAELMSALLLGGDVAPLAFARFLALVTAGNALGGFVFVAIVKYGHASVVRTDLRDPRAWRALP